ncbi:MAG TPA: Gfo/Idh/MocA family oxidoreductase [Planctomycetota bacterium]|nr:Gfo/Idh/MocA family oxidoreductase [Planctomycetota bacterium]HRR79635.1 Gfo/Idh/MocA family oxidoreductase [Planctomycetota bacterium]HRT95108.1 Gfo/Idh/MocA family oxidoreductase [Planctomycetota bacterium]
MAGKSAMSRRGFLALGGAGLVAPYALTSGALGAQGQPPASDQVAVGMIGCGGRGGGLGCGRVLAVCDTWRNRRENLAQRMGATPHADFRELLDRKDLDAVTIGTPDHWHVPIAVAAAKAGKDMYVEKPLGVSIHEDLVCRQAVRRYGRIFQYGTQQRSSAHCRYGCELVRNGRIGEVKEIIVIAPNSGPGGNTKPMPVPEGLDYDLWLGPARWTPFTGCPLGGGNWYHCYDYALGFIAGWGAHPLDILVWGYDIHKAGIWEVEATGKIASEGRHDAVYDWDVRITFGNGVRLRFTPGGDHTRFIGTQGWVGISRGYLKAEPEELLKSPIGPDEIHLPVSHSHGGNFLEAVRTRVDPVSFIEDAVRSDLVSHVGDLAVRLGRKLRWDPVKEQFLDDPDANRLMRRPMREPWAL